MSFVDSSVHAKIEAQGWIRAIDQDCWAVIAPQKVSIFYHNVLVGEVPIKEPLGSLQVNAESQQLTVVYLDHVVERWHLRESRRVWRHTLSPPDDAPIHSALSDNLLVQLWTHREQLWLFKLSENVEAVPVQLTGILDPAQVKLLTVSPCGTFAGYVYNKTVRIVNITEHFIALVLNDAMDISSLAFSDNQVGVAYTNGLVQVHVIHRTRYECPYCGKMIKKTSHRKHHISVCEFWSNMTRTARRDQVRRSECQYCNKTYHENSVKRHEAKCTQNPMGNIQ